MDMMYSPPRRNRALKSSLRDRLPLTMTAAAALLVFSPPAQAAPQGGTVVSGAATITQSGNTTDINQSTGRAIINWQSFSIAAPETVNFHQPSSSSVTLNRVIGNEKSIIDGALNANGKVYLVNSAGVLIGKGASVNTAGLVASTLNIRDEDFNAGRNVFQSTGGTGEITNLGTITVTSGGYVALLGKTVSNQGVISATKGTVTLGGGSKVTLNFNGDSLVSVSVDEGALNALVENRQAIYADGGTVILTAKAADELLAAQVNNDGLIQARTIDDLKGSIQLYAHGGTANVSGTLDASAPIAGDGGFIETSGTKVKIADSAVITTLAATGKGGTWLIDPDGYTIAASGGDITGAALGGRLNTNGNITILSTDGTGTGGNIDVNDAVSWSSNGILTLSATNAINVNKSIDASGANAGLTLNAGGNVDINAAIALTGANAALAMTSGGNVDINAAIALTGANAGLVMTSGGGYSINTTNGAKVTLSGTGSSLSINGQGYTLIRDMAGLAAISGGGGYYALAKDLDALGTTYTGAVVATLDGVLAGLGHTVSNLTINNSGGTNIALVGQLGSASASSATIRDLGVVNANVTSTGNQIGALVGINWGIVKNDYATGTVSGTQQYVGGLVGRNHTGSITGSHSDVAVSGRNFVGGLTGYSLASGTITTSYATGAVTGAGVINGGGGLTASNYIGGLIGFNEGNLSNSYTTSTATVTTTNSTEVGGLAGANSGTMTDVTARGAVTATWTAQGNNGQNIGGLVGKNTSPGTITRGSATGNVTVTSQAGYAVTAVGGLVGYTDGSSITASSASGNVTGIGQVTTVGGLVGRNVSTSISDSTASGNVSGLIEVGGFVGNNNAGGTISSSSSSGNATSTGNGTAGGFVGANSGAVTNSSSSGNVTGKGYIGGFAGTNAGTINGVTASGDTYSLGKNATGKVGVGGLVGYNSGRVLNSHATGSGAAGLTGINTGTITNSWYVDQKAALIEARKDEADDRAHGVIGSNISKKSASTTEIAREAGGQESRSPSTDDRLSISDSSSYSVNIKSVEVDGVRYNLEEPSSTAGGSK